MVLLLRIMLIRGLQTLLPSVVVCSASAVVLHSFVTVSFVAAAHYLIHIRVYLWEIIPCTGMLDGCRVSEMGFDVA